jgi:hypothetical protein
MGGALFALPHDAVAQTSTSPVALQAFLKQYANTPFAAKAQARLAGLSDLMGDWENIDPASRSIVRIQIADSAARCRSASGAHARQLLAIGAQCL